MFILGLKVVDLIVILKALVIWVFVEIMRCTNIDIDIGGVSQFFPTSNPVFILFKQLRTLFESWPTFQKRSEELGVAGKQTIYEESKQRTPWDI